MFRGIYYGNNLYVDSILDQNLFLVDCKWSDWRLGECSTTCGDGLRVDHRFQEIEAAFGGAPCEAEAQMTEQCNERLCPGKRVRKPK